jgi:sarcosine oxidase
MAYDVIVLGVGAIGSAAAFHIAQRGRRVLGLDAYELGHTWGASHGRTRAIREAHFEAPEYVPLVQRAYTLWRELEAASGRRLLTITGGLSIGPPDGPLVQGALRSARTHGLTHDYLTPAEMAARFPGFRLTDDLVAVREANAGILELGACIAAHLERAVTHGAEVRHAEPVLRWLADGAGVRVETARGSYTAEQLVITAGPWAGEVLAELVLPLTNWRVVSVQFESTRPELFRVERCPQYFWAVPEGIFGGFPWLPGEGLKIGRHDAGEACTPGNVRRQVDRSEVEALRAVLDRYMPGAAGTVRGVSTCLYTNTPDRHFIVDRHPTHPQVLYACGFSGHGFKFASVMGETLADLALDGATHHPIGFLSAARFAAPEPGLTSLYGRTVFPTPRRQ